MSLATLAKVGYPVMLDAALAELVPLLHLYTNDPPVTADSTADEFVEAVYDGYAPQTLKRWAPAALRGEQAFSPAETLTFRFGGGTPPLPIRGYFVTTGTGAVLLWAWRAPGDPLPLGPDKPQLTVYVEARFPPDVPGAE